MKSEPQLKFMVGIVLIVPCCRPDLVVFMDVTEEVAKQRGGFGEER